MKYITFAESQRLNGDRHMANAARHIANGHPEWAAGSIRKAERNYARAKMFDAPGWIKPLIEIFERNAAMTILGGEPR